MGEFLTFDYLNRHAEVDRAKESKDFLEKCTKYLHTLKSPLSNEEEDLKPDKQKDPRPFRPSSSRMNPLLSSIGFNVHVQKWGRDNCANGTFSKCDLRCSSRSL